MRHRLRAVGRTVLTIMLAHWSLSDTAAAPPAQTYVLEVIGLGVSLDKHRQGKLWDALQKGHPFATIREMDPNKYPYKSSDKLGYEGGASASALENGVGGLPMYWAAPSFYAKDPRRIQIALLPTQTHQSESWVAPTPTACP